MIVWNFRMWLLPVSLVLDLPVNSCKKSWYSRVSETCILFDEYIFIVVKKDINSSNSPSDLPPPSARISPNLSHVQWGNTMDFGDTPRRITLSATRSRISTSCSWKADLQRPLKKNRIVLLVIFNSNVVSWVESSIFYGLIQRGQLINSMFKFIHTVPVNFMFILYVT